MAGEQRQEWKWVDIFRSIGMAFSFSRLMTGFLGLAFMVAADGLLTWVMGFEDWHRGGWTEWFGHEFLWWARWVVVGYVFLFTATAIAYSVKGELLEGEGEGVKACIGFVFRKFGTIFRTPLIFWIYMFVMAGFFGFLFWVFPALVARWIWEPPLFVPVIWYTVGFFFVFIFSVLAAMGFLAFLFSFFLSPPIIAVRQEGALDAVLDTIDLMRGKGAFWVAMLALGAAILVGPAFMGKTFDVGYDVARMAMGDDFTTVVAAMPEEIQPRDDTLFEWTRQFWPGRYGGVRPRLYGKGIKYATGGADVRIQHRIAGWILGVWVLILAGFTVSFAMGAFVSAGTITYLIVREEEEFLEPMTSANTPTSAAPGAAPAAAPEPKADAEDKGDKSEGKADDKKD